MRLLEELVTNIKSVSRLSWWACEQAATLLFDLIRENSAWFVKVGPVEHTERAG